MFNKETTKFNDNKEAETIIGPTVKVKGNFHGQGNIIIEGYVEGSVKTTNHLIVSAKAKILASVEAKEAKIGGHIDGNIKIDGYLEISSTAIINGDIEASELSIERGAVVNGKCTMGKQTHQAATEK
ncbi:MAG: polymer-forming cytoskeletal protein [Candidatus Gastranaerophilaceae bacterium]|jgi:cytoskeletal protein CcmA (bactofilin family)